jgi:hypothetical protein
MAKLLSGTRIYGNATVDTNLIVSGTTTSVSSTTGALTVGGGVGIAGNLYVGGNLVLTGNLSILGNISSVNYETVTNTEIVATLQATNVYAATVGNIGANIVGTGTYLTALNASNLSSGTVPSAQISGSYTGITAIGTLTALSVAGNASVSGNLSVGNLNIASGNVTVSNSGSFIGNAVTGYGALYAGIPSGYAILPSTPFEIATNANTYSQLNMQNINNGAQASSDYIITADNGSDSTYYGDFGIASSTYYYPSLGLTAIGPNDTYILGVGYNSLGPYTGNVGNVVISSSNGMIKLATGGANVANVVATVIGTGFSVNASTRSTSTTTGALVVAGGAGIAGNVFVGNVLTSGLYWSSNGAPMSTGSGTGITYTASATAPAGPKVGDQWYYTTGDVLYEYQNVGTGSFWVDITGPQTITSGTVTVPGGGDLSPFLLMGA